MSFIDLNREWYYAKMMQLIRFTTAVNLIQNIDSHFKLISFWIHEWHLLFKNIEISGIRWAIFSWKVSFDKWIERIKSAYFFAFEKTVNIWQSKQIINWLEKLNISIIYIFIPETTTGEKSNCAFIATRILFTS